MADVFIIKQGDLLRNLSATLGPIDPETGEVEEGDDLTDGVVIFNMRNADTGENKIEDGAVVVDDALTGEVHYEWQPGDTDEPGAFVGEFEVTYPGDKPITYPNDKLGFKIKITEEIA